MIPPPERIGAAKTEALLYADSRFSTNPASRIPGIPVSRSCSFPGSPLPPQGVPNREFPVARRARSFPRGSGRIGCSGGGSTLLRTGPGREPPDVEGRDSRCRRGRQNSYPCVRVQPIRPLAILLGQCEYRAVSGHCPPLNRVFQLPRCESSHPFQPLGSLVPAERGLRDDVDAGQRRGKIRRRLPEISRLRVFHLAEIESFPAGSHVRLTRETDV